jgi:hypothetical protein
MQGWRLALPADPILLRDFSANLLTVKKNMFIDRCNPALLPAGKFSNP